MPQQTGFFRPPPGNEPRDRSADASTPHVWTLVNGKPTLVKLTPGPSDGRFTVVEAGSLQVGTPVITDLAVTAG
jgi:hypothetical protein